MTLSNFQKLETLTTKQLSTLLTEFAVVGRSKCTSKEQKIRKLLEWVGDVPETVLEYCDRHFGTDFLDCPEPVQPVSFEEVQDVVTAKNIFGAAVEEVTKVLTRCLQKPRNERTTYDQKMVVIYHRYKLETRNTSKQVS